MQKYVKSKIVFGPNTAPLHVLKKEVRYCLTTFMLKLHEM